MKKLIYLGTGLALCMGAALITGCEKNKEEEPASVVDVTIGENYEETAFGMRLQMVAVEGGTFQMGATEEQGDGAYANEKPVHSVTLDGYYIGKYEITQAQWEAVMRTNPSYFAGDDLPVEQVSWNEAVEFCEKLSAQTGKKYRLPTEAEWEYAARGGDKADGTKYAGGNSIGDVAWFGVENDGKTPGNSNNTTHPVGQKKPNGLGLYDMSGNVWEWCSDRKGDYSASPSVNPQGPGSGVGRMYRGGSWVNYAQSCRVSNRGYDASLIRGNGLGFRVVCER